MKKLASKQRIGLKPILMWDNQGLIRLLGSPLGFKGAYLTSTAIRLIGIHLKTPSNNLNVQKFINKPRPERRTDGHAFPSGDISFVFQGASFLKRRYRRKYGAPTYQVAGYVDFNRLEGLKYDLISIYSRHLFQILDNPVNVSFLTRK